MPNRDSIYHETNDLIGKHPLVEAYTPSLVWNRSFLIPKRPDFDRLKGDSNGRRISLEEIRRSVDNAILEFLKGHAGEGFEVDPCLDGNLMLFTGAFDPGSIGQGRNAVARDKSVLSQASARVLDADERAIVLRGSCPAQSRPKAAPDAYDVIVRIHIRTNLFTLSIIATPRNREAIALESAGDFQHLTFDFWAELSKTFLTPFALRRDLAEPSLRGIFADSRGVIISSFAIAASRAEHTTFVPGICWADPVIKHLAPILTPLEARGCTASYLLDKRAVSLTFGNEPLAQPKDTRRPLTFVICIHGGALNANEQGWATQMGHVLDRSHTITTMRLAALLDLKLLRDASIELAKVDDLKARARELISAYEKDEIAGGSAHVAVDRVRRHLADINSAFLEANAAGVGLTFRIESSRYYIEEFRKHVESLRLSPIDGYQSYAQTIDQNIGIVFEFISRLGSRYDRLVGETRSIEQSFSTVQTRHTGNLIAELQRNGELILIGVLVPYYLISIFAHIAGAPEKLDGTSTLLWQMTNAAIFLGCASLAIYRFQVSKNKPKSLKTPKARQNLVWQLLYGAVIAGAVLLALSAALHAVTESSQTRETRPALESRPAQTLPARKQG